MDKVIKTDQEWKDILGDLEYDVLRKHGTERAGTHDDFPQKPGVFMCKGCDSPLFDSSHKFESGTGWPSFYQPIDGVKSQNVEEKSDTRFFMRRTEVHCNRCGGHLVHVFPDGPDPTGLRYCINGVALKFNSQSSSEDG